MVTSLTGALRASVENRQRHPLCDFRPTDDQRRFLSCTERLAVWLAANQIGKSVALAHDIAWSARGDHPFRVVHRPPVSLFVVSYSERQMKPLIGKVFHALAPWERDPKLTYTEGGGLKGYKDPHITLVDGPGAGSVIHFRTYKQGTQAMAGPTLHGVWCDEPMTQEVYGELIPRLNVHQGTMRITQTVTPSAPPQRWLHELVKAGKVHELHTPFSLDAITPRGGLCEAPWLTPEEAQSTYDAFLGDELGLRRDALWEVPSSSRWILNFTVPTDAVPPDYVRWVVGIDHGEKAGKQAAVLIAVDLADDLRPRVWAVDESNSDGRTTPEEDAAAIIAMLTRNGLEAGDVAHWVGDHPTGRTTDERTKSNLELMRHLRSQSNSGVTIARPQKGHDSVRPGARVINALFGRRSTEGKPLAHVHHRCERLADALRHWDNTAKTEEHKDVFDAYRYAVCSQVGMQDNRFVTFGAPWR